MKFFRLNALVYPMYVSPRRWFVPKDTVNIYSRGFVNLFMQPGRWPWLKSFIRFNLAEDYLIVIIGRHAHGTKRLWGEMSVGRKVQKAKQQHQACWIACSSCEYDSTTTVSFSLPVGNPSSALPRPNPATTLPLA